MGVVRQIKVERDKSFLDRKKVLFLTVDDYEEIEIQNGEIKTFSLDNNGHRIHFYIPRNLDKTIHIPRDGLDYYYHVCRYDAEITVLEDIFQRERNLQLTNNAEQSLDIEFDLSGNIGRIISVDEDRKLIKLYSIDLDLLLGSEERVYEFKDIIGFELIENNGAITKGGFGAAVAGGLLFGGAGAVAGSVLGKKNHAICNNLSLRITMKDSKNPLVSIAFHIGYTDTFYFIEVFKKTYGCTPFRYRRLKSQI